MSIRDLESGELASLASVLEVSAPKPGNVHRGADFKSTTFQDFLLSASVLGHVITRDQAEGVGKTILNAIREIRAIVGQNTNLGIVLLLVPLCKADKRLADKHSGASPLEARDVTQVLAEVTGTDAELVFEAIRMAAPGGLKSSREVETGRYDVTTVPRQLPADALLDAMQTAASRDRVAYQYATGYETIFDVVVPCLEKWNRLVSSESEAIVMTHVELMSQFPDSLIARKCGDEVADESALRARKCLDIWANGDFESFWNEVSEFDFWLRCDGNRRNPGTTADLIAAGLFVALRNGNFVCGSKV